MAEHRRSQRTDPAAQPGSADAARGLDRTALKGDRLPTSTLTSTSSTRVGCPRVHESRRAARAAFVPREDGDGGLPARAPGAPGAGPSEEPWVTRRQLADHLQVTPRWIELQHRQGLPHLRRGGIVRYRISDIEAWLLTSPASGGA
jgi:hypothetical protein